MAYDVMRDTEFRCNCICGEEKKVFKFFYSTENFYFQFSVKFNKSK